MLTSAMFTDFATNLTQDVVTIIPTALGVMASLWGLRLGIKYFKGIAR